MIKAGDSFDIVRPTVVIVYIAFTMFIYCYLEEQIVAAFEKINESAYEMSWYLMPIDMRKQLLSMMAIAQRPVYLRGFGSIRCSHAFFRKV